MEEQLRRMLKDTRMRGMAREFGARWLGVRDFVTNHGRNLEQFPEFTPAVRDALAEEPVRFFEDLLVNDRSASSAISTCSWPGNHGFIFWPVRGCVISPLSATDTKISSLRSVESR